jgi:origin recognition complex subunit 3
MDHEKCYVFSHERPAKRRRVENDKSLDSSLPLRRKLYLDIWDQQRQRIDNVIKTANETTLEGITSFLRESQLDEAFDSLSAGFILAGPNISAHAIIFEQLQERNSDERSTIFITVSSSDASNLKTLLKAIIKIGTSQRTTDEDELSLAPSKRSGRRLLDYDLELLHDFVQENNVKQIVLAVRDCEAVDSLVLSEAIELLLYVDKLRALPEC